jgi:Flp pilus assembly protein TadD
MLRAWSAEASDPRVAVALARHLAADHPHDARALRVAARILARNGAADEAAGVYDRAIARFPGDWRTWVARATDAPTDGRVEAWRDAFAAGAPAKFLQAAWPSLPVGLYWLDVAASREARFSANLGAFLETRGDLDTAALAYEQAYLVDPGELPHPGYARVLIALGRHDEAATFVASALAVRPGDPNLQHQHAELLEARGQLADAASVWLELGRQRPTAMVRALRATEKADGAPAAVRLADRVGLTRKLEPLVVLEVARLKRDAGDLAGCAVDLESAGLLGHRELGARAQALRRTCSRR